MFNERVWKVSHFLCWQLKYMNIYNCFTIPSLSYILYMTISYSYLMFVTGWPYIVNSFRFRISYLILPWCSLLNLHVEIEILYFHFKLFDFNWNFNFTVQTFWLYRGIWNDFNYVNNEYHVFVMISDNTDGMVISVSRQMVAKRSSTKHGELFNVHFYWFILSSLHQFIFSCKQSMTLLNLSILLSEGCPLV